MNVFTAIIPLMLSIGAFANPSFRFEDGIVDSRCPVYDNSMNPVHLPHATDCGKFYKCFSGRAFMISCPPGQEFGAAIQRCDYPAFAMCRSGLAEPEPAEFKFDNGIVDPKCPINDNPMKPVHLPHPTSCQKFMKCFSGKKFEIQCPPGQEWANELNRCDFPSIAKCSLSQPFLAENEGERENEADMSGNDSENIEILPVKAEFNYNTGVPDVRCPRIDDPFRPIHLAHPTNCGKFQKCFDGRAYVLDCPPGQEFGVKLNRCDFPPFAQCSLHKRKNLSKSLGKAFDYYYYSDEDDIPLESSEWTEEQRETIAGVSDIRCPKIDDIDNPIHLTHPKDCSKFYKCYDGRAYLIQCPPGQQWSVRFDRCDHPKVAKCTIRP
ncbi:probable chitinase 10 [Toxorhynchites rutilus septentrionalis]|uniref:probable chitinase 10 n=1 Tax=Toxorhynchites rutilus septentrionalis TaxID=329112 RepID=UPI002478A325|nr:probable chitinase 10 [Toxorhynchites rutilus septentrionalis]